MKFLRFKSFPLMIGLFLLVSESLETAYADAASPSLGGLAYNITSIIGSLGHFLTAVAFIISFGFGVGSMIKYKAHRDNPQMISLREPVTMLVLCLAFLALGITSLLVGEHLFGGAPHSGGYQGTSTF